MVELEEQIKAAQIEKWRIYGAKELEANLTCVIEYRDMDGNYTKRKVKIRTILVIGSGPYLSAWCYLRKEPRFFVLDRVLSCSDYQTGEIIDLSAWIRKRIPTFGRSDSKAQPINAASTRIIVPPDDQAHSADLNKFIVFISKNIKENNQWQEYEISCATLEQAKKKALNIARVSWSKAKVTYTAWWDEKHSIWVSHGEIKSWVGYDKKKISRDEIWALVTFARNTGKPNVFSEHKSLEEALRSCAYNKRWKGQEELLRFIPWRDNSFSYKNALTIVEAHKHVQAGSC
jgi:hypothetical protein